MTGRTLDHARMRILWLRLWRPRLAAGVASGIQIYVLSFVFSSVSGRLRLILSWAFIHTILSFFYATRNLALTINMLGGLI